MLQCVHLLFKNHIYVIHTYINVRLINTLRSPDLIWPVLTWPDFSQFHYHDIDIEFDPPSFIQNKVDELYSDKNKVSREEEEEDGFGDSGGGGGGYHGDGVEDVHIEVVVEEDSPERDDDEVNLSICIHGLCCLL